MNGINLISTGPGIEEMLRIGLSVIFMGICGIQDYRYRRISLRVCAVAGAAAILFGIRDLASGLLALPGILACLLPGFLLLMAAYAAEGSAGTGDGVCFLILGLFLGAKEVWTVVLAAALLSALTGIVLVVQRRAGRKSRLPFLTFGAVAWMGLMLARSVGIEW